MKTYQLINSEGCLMDKVEESSFKKAREYFAAKFVGEYSIVWEDDEKNVRLK